ncbi:hypothetical protein NQ315_016746 [Exocentrus adspersus]|uniref:Reverse transcriptase n=1 Tax=Exocentrus adspersus TaxID=1586481 RepID=A0AAV8VDG0_9CUCU|nr:hypothetical protein NQ315_016746 [Exocentrus adspersus]
MALRVASAYRTVSTEAVLVVAELIPIENMVEERNMVYRTEGELDRAKKDARETVMRKWQERWESSEKGRWTRELISQIGAWKDRKHGEIDYYITQALTGHGSFMSYLKRIRKLAEDKCRYCEGVDTPRHTLFECERWDGRSIRMNLEVGEEVTAANMIQLACATKQGWDAVMGYVKGVVREKERRLRNYVEED